MLNVTGGIEKSHDDQFAELPITLRALKCSCIFGIHTRSSTERLLGAIPAPSLQSVRANCLRQTFACFEAASVLE